MRSIILSTLFLILIYGVTSYNSSHNWPHSLQTSTNWIPLLHPSVRRIVNTASEATVSRKPALFTQSIMRNYSVPSHENPVKKIETNDTKGITPKKSTKQIDLETIIDQKMKKYSENLFEKLDKMIRVIVEDAVKKTAINHSSTIELTETGNGQIRPVQSDEPAPHNHHPVKEVSRKSSSTDLIDNVIKIEQNPIRKLIVTYNGADDDPEYPVPDRIPPSANRVGKSVYPSGPFNYFHKTGYNSAEHSPPDPYVALMLSHYGRYLSRVGRTGQNCIDHPYSYLASNNLHNNKPFGSYKVYEDADT